jgi:PKHD-type hydroxylase
MYALKYEPFEPFATIPNAFQPHELKLIRSYIEKDETISGTVGMNEINKDIRDSKIKWLLTDDPQYTWVFQKIAGLVSDVNANYFGIELRGSEAIQLTEYDSVYNGFYGQHSDSSYVGPMRNRKLSVTMQLSNPDEYEGGELNLYHQNFKTPFVASRELGAMTLFRSHIIHEVMPVTKGKRYSFVTWIQGPLWK